MKLGAITFSILLATGVAGSIAFTGCSGEDPQPAPAVVDSGTDSGQPDTFVPKVDTGTPPPPSCAASIDGFSCEPAADRPGKTVCTDEMIEEFLNCFGADGDEAKCTAATTKYPQCNTCILRDEGGWLKVNPDTGGGSIDVAACVKKVDPTGTCSGATNCYFDCNDWVCGECDTTPGSGSTGSMNSSEARECELAARNAGTGSKPKGACYDNSYKEYNTCRSDTRFQYCFVTTVASLRYFLRGACRDNGNWSDVTTDKPTATDAGTDAPTDTGTTPTDTGTTPTDTGTTPTDTGSDAAVDDSGSDAAAD